MQHETGITFVFVTHDQEEALTMSDRVAVMSAGKILQVGSPTDIYEHPTHRFVADFIGDTNFLEAKVISVEKDFAMVELESGVRCKATVPAGMQVDGKVSVAIRPEQVSLQLAAGEHSLSGQIENIIYFGTDTICHLVLDGDVPFSVRLQNKGGARSGLEIGNKISVEIPDGALQVLRD